MEEKKYKLNEAVKQFYKTEPLPSDFARSVSEKVFISRKLKVSTADRWVFGFAIVMGMLGIIYSFSFFTAIPTPFLILIVFCAVCMAGLGRKEYLLFSIKMRSITS